MASSKRKALSLSERMDVIKRLEENKSQTSIAKTYGIHPSTISRILKLKTGSNHVHIENGHATWTYTRCAKTPV